MKYSIRRSKEGKWAVVDTEHQHPDHSKWLLVVASGTEAEMTELMIRLNERYSQYAKKLLSNFKYPE